MSRIWGSAFIVMTAAIVASATAPACADNDMSIFVQGMLAPPQARTTSGCTYVADPTAPRLLGTGQMDIALTDTYQANLLVGNQLIPRGDPANTRAESNRVHVQGAVVTVKRTDGSTISEFTSTAVNGLADPQNNNTPGYEIVGVSLIDAATVGKLAGVTRVEVHVKVFGRTLGGKDVESGDWSVPISICSGCLIDFSAGYDPAQMPTPNCKRAGGTTTSGSTNTLPCHRGQDGEGYPCGLCLGIKECNPQ